MWTLISTFPNRMTISWPSGTHARFPPKGWRSWRDNSFSAVARFYRPHRLSVYFGSGGRPLADRGRL